jgi:DNA-directed RNA polymerase specialized sigma24 family protein
VVDDFQTTRWSLIVAAGGADHNAATALAELCQAYWRPVFAYVRRRGYAADAAADATQAFFLHLLEYGVFARADESRGRFRAYLLTSAHNFLAGARARERTQRRGGNAPHDPIDASDAGLAPALSAKDTDSLPDAVFARHWALNVVERALHRVHAEYAARGQQATFDELRPLLTSDGAATPGPAADAAPSDAARRTALSRARRRFAAALRAEIRETVSDPGDVDDELRFLLQVLTG